MKKIKDFKKFENAQDEDEFDYDYVKQCFIDLIEAGTIEYLHFPFRCKIVWHKGFAHPEIIGGVYRNFSSDDRSGAYKKRQKNIDAYLKSLDKTKEVMLDIQAGIERVMEEYPDYICDIYFDESVRISGLGVVPSIIVTISS
jgi:hypothetical protein